MILLLFNSLKNSSNVPDVEIPRVLGLKANTSSFVPDTPVTAKSPVVERSSCSPLIPIALTFSLLLLSPTSLPSNSTDQVPLV